MFELSKWRWSFSSSSTQNKSFPIRLSLDTRSNEEKILAPGGHMQTQICRPLTTANLDQADLGDWNLQDWKMTDNIARVEIAARQIPVCHFPVLQFPVLQIHLSRRPLL